MRVLGACQREWFWAAVVGGALCLLKALADLLARIDLAREFIDVHGLMRNARETHPVLQLLSRWERRAWEMLSALPAAPDRTAGSAISGISVGGFTGADSRRSLTSTQST